jgi:hypothetical protein
MMILSDLAIAFLLFLLLLDLLLHHLDQVARIVNDMIQCLLVLGLRARVQDGLFIWLCVVVVKLLLLLQGLLVQVKGTLVGDLLGD